MRKYHLALAGLAVIIILPFFIGGWILASWIQQRACFADGYPRTVNVGIIWPDTRCVKLLNGSEVIR